MRDPRLRFETDLTGLDADAWMRRVEDLAEEHGSFTPLGSAHASAFLDAGRSLLVTFEAVPTILDRRDASPMGFDLARTESWSVLAMLSTAESWFRETRVYRYIDRLTDDGFFEDFDRVLFFGGGAGGYAAAAFSVAAPGARVLALQPQATLDPAVAGWDARVAPAAAADFTDRYGYAPDMLDGAERAHIVFCPQDPADARHAALFHKSHVTMLHADDMPGPLIRIFDRMQIVEPMLRAGMDGTLDAARFGQLFKFCGRSAFGLGRLALHPRSGESARMDTAPRRSALRGE